LLINACDDPHDLPIALRFHLHKAQFRFPYDTDLSRKRQVSSHLGLPTSIEVNLPYPCRRTSESAGPFNLVLARRRFKHNASQLGLLKHRYARLPRVCGRTIRNLASLNTQNEIKLFRETADRIMFGNQLDCCDARRATRVFKVC
jgi:hypothetical protein